jgi:hypothetical protein
MLCGNAGEVDEHALAGVNVLDVARRNPDSITRQSPCETISITGPL